MTMQTALQKPAFSARKGRAVDAQRADRVADEVAEEGVFVLGVFTLRPSRGSPPTGSAAVQRQRQQVVKKKVTASMCAGL
jgi:hypothetical protein